MASKGETVAWLIENCPNFHFLPSMYYDRIFTTWGTVQDKMSPAYWTSLGTAAKELIHCSDEHALYWIVNGTYGVYSREDADAARSLGKKVVPVTVNDRKEN